MPTRGAPIPTPVVRTPAHRCDGTGLQPALPAKASGSDSATASTNCRTRTVTVPIHGETAMTEACERGWRRAQRAWRPIERKWPLLELHFAPTKPPPQPDPGMPVQVDNRTRADWCLSQSRHRNRRAIRNDTTKKEPNISREGDEQNNGMHERGNEFHTVRIRGDDMMQ
jgi:hypothetical protein